MANEQEIADVLRRLIYHRRRLAALLLHMAIAGITADPKYPIEVEEIRTDIRHIKRALRTWGVAIKDHPNDTDSADLEREFGADHPGPRRSGVTPLGMRLPLSLRDVQVERISALRELMEQIPEMRDVVISCHAALRSASKHLYELHGYKSLHDSLHTIQRQCYEQIQGAAQKLFNDGSGGDQLEIYLSDLEGYINELQKIVDAYSFLRSITSWLPKFAAAYTTMCSCISPPDAERFDNALGQIGIVLRVFPSKLHQELKEAAQKMDLEVLLASMSDIRDRIIDLRVEDNVMRSFSDDVSQLRQLIVLVGNHGRWQAIDVDLDLIERNLNQVDERNVKYGDLVVLWDMIKERAEALCAASEENWAHFLRKQAELLEDAIGKRDTPGIARHIQTYRSRASRQFYNVDGQLKELCKKLDGPESMLAVMRGVLA